jgi:hypothetical protein
MKNPDERVRLNSRHFTKTLILEFAYCIAVFLCFTFLHQKITDWRNAVMTILAYQFLLLLVPLGFNIVQIVKARQNNDFGKLSNYIIIEVLLLIFVFWFTLYQ